MAIWGLMPSSFWAGGCLTPNSLFIFGQGKCGKVPGIYDKLYFEPGGLKNTVPILYNLQQLLKTSGNDRKDRFYELLDSAGDA